MLEGKAAAPQAATVREDEFVELDAEGNPVKTPRGRAPAKKAPAKKAAPGNEAAAPKADEGAASAEETPAAE